MIDAVRRYDGYVVQSTGDGIFALFGAPVAHEDHPQRALYAALRMQEELRRYSAQLSRGRQPARRCRVGVNTGEVVVRSIATGGGHTEYTPIGHTTNLASRMQAVAPTGSIAISEATRKLVRRLLRAQAAGTDQDQRRQRTGQCVRSYRPWAAAHASATRGGARANEIRRARARDGGDEARRRAGQAGHGQIVAAMAEAGVGKSRLFFEFKATSQSGWMVLEAFSVSHGKASAYLPLIDLLHGYFGIQGRRRCAQPARKGRGQGAGSIAALEDTLPYLFALLGIVEGAIRWRRWTAQVQATAHAGRDQAHPSAREPQSAADGDLRGPALDRRGDPGVSESARRLDRHREDPAAGQLSS